MDLGCWICDWKGCLGGCGEPEKPESTEAKKDDDNEEDS